MIQEIDDLITDHQNTTNDDSEIDGFDLQDHQNYQMMIVKLMDLIYRTTKTAKWWSKEIDWFDGFDFGKTTKMTKWWFRIWLIWWIWFIGPPKHDQMMVQKLIDLLDLILQNHRRPKTSQMMVQNLIWFMDLIL